MLAKHYLDENCRFACKSTKGLSTTHKPSVTCTRCLKILNKKTKQKPRHLKLMQPEIDDRVPTILCGNAQPGDTSTKMINSRYAPVTCEGCKAKMKESKKTPVKQHAADLPADDNEPLQSMGADWEATWTAKRAEEELIGFKFKGLGWYITHDKSGAFDTMIVMPYGLLDTEHPNKLINDSDEPDGTKLYKFYVYNGRNPAETFNWLVNAPTRQDERV